jgi:ubiquinol-cytochrome c reductase iron-sulfur subunit
MSVRKVPPGLPTVAQPDRHRRFWVAITGAMGGVAVVTTAVPFVATLTPSERATAAGGGPSWSICPTFRPVRPRPSRGAASRSGWSAERRPCWPRCKGMTRNGSIRRRHATSSPPLPATTPVPSSRTFSWRSASAPTWVARRTARPPARPAPACRPTDRPGGYLCPCHGSTFDAAGRVFKNKPAPTNLEVSPHALWLCQRDTDRHRQRHGLTTRPHHQTPNHEATPWVFRTEATKPTSSSTRP